MQSHRGVITSSCLVEVLQCWKLEANISFCQQEDKILSQKVSARKVLSQKVSARKILSLNVSARKIISLNVSAREILALNVSQEDSRTYVSSRKLL